MPFPNERVVVAPPRHPCQGVAILDQLAAAELAAPNWRHSRVSPLNGAVALGSYAASVTIGREPMEGGRLVKHADVRRSNPRRGQGGVPAGGGRRASTVRQLIQRKNVENRILYQSVEPRPRSMI